MNPGGLHWYHPPGTPRDVLVEVATNLDGHRVAADARWQHDGPADIVAVGCSFTFGFGVKTDEAFPARLAHILGRPVVNAGVPAYGTVGSLDALDGALHLRPRVIVYGLVDVHLERNVRPCAPAWTPYCRPQARVVRDHEGTLTIAPPHQHVLGDDAGLNHHEQPRDERFLEFEHDGVFVSRGHRRELARVDHLHAPHGRPSRCHPPLGDHRGQPPCAPHCADRREPPGE